MLFCTVRTLYVSVRVHISIVSSNWFVLQLLQYRMHPTAVPLSVLIKTYRSILCMYTYVLYLAVVALPYLEAIDAVCVCV
jgi:hypothetical protein